MNYRDLFQIDATLIANEFLDKYMPRANGDYVKVYLYLLKNCSDYVDYGTVAEALSLTEGDVIRAVRYWEKEGILAVGKNAGKPKAQAQADAAGTAQAQSQPQQQAAGGMTMSMCGAAGSAGSAGIANIPNIPNIAHIAPSTPDPASRAEAKVEDAKPQAASAQGRSRYSRAESAAILDRLSEDANFSQLLFVVQKYMSKILAENEQQVFAYLYDGLGMSCELLDYLVDYCVQRGHSNIRYIEKVGLDWAERGIRDVRAAKTRTREFDRAAEETAQRRTVSQSRKGAVRGTDYDSIAYDEMLSRKI